MKYQLVLQFKQKFFNDLKVLEKLEDALENALEESLTIGSGGPSDWNRKRITQNYQDHHIIPQQLKAIPENMSRPEAASMTAEERKKLPPNERRTFHQGPHDKEVVRDIQWKMDQIERNGRSNNWISAQ